MIDQPDTKLVQTASKFQALLNLIEGSQWKRAISNCHKRYKLKQCNVFELHPQLIREYYYVLFNRYYLKEKDHGRWNENELRIFAWFLITYSALIQKDPAQFKQNDWQRISEIFYFKTVDQCQFQYKYLKKYSHKASKWSAEEDQLLCRVMEAKGYIQKWNEIGQHFYKQSGKAYFRTPKRIRERWLNYLDPRKQIEVWNPEEEYQLIRIIQNVGKRWAVVAKDYFDGKKTEHMIKNKYMTLRAKYFKEFPEEDIEDLDENRFVKWAKDRNNNGLLEARLLYAPEIDQYNFMRNLDLFEEANHGFEISMKIKEQQTRQKQESEPKILLEMKQQQQIKVLKFEVKCMDLKSELQELKIIMP